MLTRARKETRQGKGKERKRNKELGKEERQKRTHFIALHRNPPSGPHPPAPRTRIGTDIGRRKKKKTGSSTIRQWL